MFDELSGSKGSRDIANLPYFSESVDLDLILAYRLEWSLKSVHPEDILICENTEIRDKKYIIANKDVLVGSKLFNDHPNR